LSNAPPLSPHEVFGFAPYWTLPQSGSFDVAGLTTIAYFSVGVNADGSLDRTGSGWAGYQSQALADLITRAHAAGDRVVLTVNDFDQSSLDHLTSSPTASTTLAAQLVSAIEAKHLDGVNLDLEGEGSGDQAGLTTLVTTVSNALHGVDPHWQVTMDTYASSAGDPHGFYNITALAPHVDGFFVMAYQLNLQGAPGAASPLTSGMFSNRTSAAQYASAVDPSKVIFGLPFFGYDWPTSGDTLTATATGAPTAVTYAQAVSDGGPAYWDPVTDTAWTAYQVGKQWHEVFYEDATSLYQVAQVAQWFHFAGVGIWALGMQGGDPAPLAALDGFAPPVKVAVTGPPVTTTTTTSSTTTTTAPKKNAPTPAASTTTTSTTGTSTTTTSTGPSSTTTSTVAPTTTTTAGPGGDRSSGTWKGQPVSLTVLDTAPTGTRVHAGTLTGFTTDDPALSCLEAEPTLNVYAYGTDPAVDVVVAAEPADCTTVLLALGPAPPGATTGSSTAPTP
jgi:hypothetical protein